MKFFSTVIQSEKFTYINSVKTINCIVLNVLRIQCLKRFSKVIFFFTSPQTLNLKYINHTYTVIILIVLCNLTIFIDDIKYVCMRYFVK